MVERNDNGITRTSGMNTFVREVSANAPYDVILGFSYAFDAVPQVRVEERTVERRAKYLLLDCGKGHLIVHLGMSGRMLVGGTVLGEFHHDAGAGPGPHDAWPILERWVADLVEAA